MPDHGTIPKKIANWWLEDKLGSGYSGAIFRSSNVHTGQLVALKVQSVDHECPTNRYEKGFYPALQGGKGMPIMYGGGAVGDWDYLAIELLGKSLDSLFRASGQATFDLRSVCCMAMQLIERLAFMHSRGVLHRDIQLGNCVIGLPPNEKTVYMIDFGFSKFYIDPRTGLHIPDSKAPRDFIGNYWFSSVGVHCKGRVPSRRDDMEAVALMLIHMLTPNGLPWTRNGVPKTDEAHEKLKRHKRSVKPEELCHGLPSEFEEFLRYCRRLQFVEKPDYERWIEEFRELAVSKGFPASDDFVWPSPLTAQPIRRVQPGRSKVVSNDVEDLVRGLAKVGVEDRQVLGDLKNINKVPTPVGEKAGKKLSKPEVIEIGSDTEEDEEDEIEEEEEEDLARLGHTKATQLRRLAARAGKAADNESLASLVRLFVRVLQSNTSRTMTKEGFAFLDAVHKQLADPSVYVVPERTIARTRSMQSQSQESKDYRREKLVGLARLKSEVHRGVGLGNDKLARMVAEFGSVIEKSGNRVVTKDAFGFLEGLAEKLVET